MPTPASGVCMGKSAELESRCHEGGSKAGFMARFHGIMLRLLPDPQAHCQVWAFVQRDRATKQMGTTQANACLWKAESTSHT